MENVGANVQQADNIFKMVLGPEKKSHTAFLGYVTSLIALTALGVRYIGCYQFGIIGNGFS